MFILPWLLHLQVASDPPPPPVEGVVEASVASRLMDRLGSLDRAAMACAGPSATAAAELAEAVGSKSILQHAGPLAATWTTAVADATGRPSAGLVWLRLGDDPMVGAETTGQPPPLALADRWTTHWTESPRIRATTDHTLTIAPHGRTPAPDQLEPQRTLADAPLPVDGCAAWSRTTNIHARPVERLVTLHENTATLRVFAPSARAADVRPRVEAWSFTPASRRTPRAVMVVYTAPHTVSGAPWLQDTDIPKHMSGLSTLIPSGYTAAPGQVRAWFDDVVGAAMAVVLPVVDDAGRPAEVSTLLLDIRDRFGLPGDVEPEGHGGRLATTGGVAIGALPGALVLSTDPAILVDLLNHAGTDWTHPPTRADAAAAWWLAGRTPTTATLAIEDRMWRIDTEGGLGALQKASDWAGL